MENKEFPDELKSWGLTYRVGFQWLKDNEDKDEQAWNDLQVKVVRAGRFSVRYRVDCEHCIGAGLQNSDCNCHEDKNREWRYHSFFIN